MVTRSWFTLVGILLTAPALVGCKRRASPTAALPPAAPGSVASMDQATLAAYAGEGRRLWRVKGCETCHSLDGSNGIGASAAGMWGRMLKLKDKREVSVDEAFIRESVFDPSAAITVGYPNQMQNYIGRVTDEEMTAIAALYRALQDGPSANGATQGR